MKSAFLYFLTGAASGVLGGMGMGGGTLLIPALTVFFGLPQKYAQAINLVSFVPMAATASFIHLKNGRVVADGLAFIVIPAAITGAAFGFLAAAIDGDILKKLFGAFLVFLAVFQIFHKEKPEKKRRLNGDCPLLCDRKNRKNIF